MSVLVPLPGARMLGGAKLDVTPAGGPLTDKATADWNPFSAAVDITTAVEAPGTTVALVALGVSVKAGAVNRNVLGPREKHVRSSPN